MLFNQSDSQSKPLNLFSDLRAFEKGIVARAFLKSLVMQGSLNELPSESSPGQISITVKKWQLDLLACFSEDAELTDDEEKELLLTELCRLR